MKNLSFQFLFFISVIVLAGCQVTDAATLPAASPPDPTQVMPATETEAVTHAQDPIVTVTQPPPLTQTQTPLPKTEDKSSGEQKVTLMAVGDIMLGRTIGEMIENQGSEAPFIFTSETLSSADLTLGNLECPISARGTAEEKTYAFRAPILAGMSLAQAGFDLVNLANNHSLDYGPVGLEDTLQLLKENQIACVGAGLNEAEAYAPVFMDINGLRLAFLGFADIPPTDYDYREWEAAPSKPGIAWAHADRIQEGVRAAKQKADVVIVLVHNGHEIVQRVSESQQKIAHLAIESGAALVIGSHPHVLQRIEPYLDGLIVYSMGNFVFDNFLFPPNYSAILKVELSTDGVDSYELIDVIVQLNGVPQLMPYDHELKP